MTVPQQDDASVDDARCELEAALLAAAEPHKWPWRVSKNGNIVDASNQVVLRSSPVLSRTLRRREAARQLAGYIGLRDEQVARLRAAQAAWDRVRPTEPGYLFGTWTDDVSRVTAAHLVAALNRAAAGSHVRYAADGNIIHASFDHEAMTTQS